MAKKSFKSLFVEYDSMAKPLQKGKSLFIFCMVIVTILNFAIFYVAVNINSIALAFKELENIETNTYKLSFKHFIDFFDDVKKGTDGVFLPAFKNTMMYFWTGLAVSIPLSFFIGYFLFKKIAGYKFFRVMFFLPSMISGVVLVAMFKNILAKSGSLDFLLQKIFGKEEIFKDWFANPSDLNIMMLIFSIWTGFGSSVILFQGAMKRIPESVLEAAMLDGVSVSVELRKIITPLVWPTVMTLLTISFSAFLTASGPIMLFCGINNANRQNYTISFWIFKLISGASNDYEYASAIGVIMTIATCPIAFGVRGILNKVYEKVEY